MMNMTNEEYMDFLKAAAGEHVRLDDLRTLKLDESIIWESASKLATTAKFARLVAEIPDNDDLLEALISELKKGRLITMI